MLVLVSVLILASYHLIYFRFFPNRHGLAGHDFSLFLPRLLDGYIWAKNNSLAQIPWFTPSFCGGEPAYPDPQNVYFTLPQLLTAFFDPLQSVYLTVVAMAIAGFWGCYRLLKSVFHTSGSAAVLGATLFLFNGFSIYRLVEGQVVFHAFLLLPWVLYFTFRESSETGRRRIFRPFLVNGLVVALLASYWIYSGMVNILLPVGLSAMLVALGLVYGGRAKPESLKTALVGLCFFLLIVAGKLGAELSYLGHFDRSFYRLPGTDSLLSGIYVAFRSLFFPSTGSDLQRFMVNQTWYLGRHEFEYGVTFVPLVVMGLYAFRKAVSLKSAGGPLPRPGKRFWIVLAMIAILLVPIALNYYQPRWNEFLKTVPVLKNSSTLIRFNVMYILPTVILSAVLLDRSIGSASGRTLVAGVLVGAVVATNALTDRTYYERESYNPTGIDAAYREIRFTKRIPKIVFVADIEGTSAFTSPSQIGSDFTFGISRLSCYEPMFGYRREVFPMKTLHPGPVTDVTNGTFNVKNPACYVFPKANACQPGDQFRVDQRDEAARFLSYLPFDFRLPLRQVVLDYTSLIALTACLLMLLMVAIERLFPRPKRAPG